MSSAIISLCLYTLLDHSHVVWDIAWVCYYDSVSDDSWHRNCSNPEVHKRWQGKEDRTGSLSVVFDGERQESVWNWCTLRIQGKKNNLGKVGFIFAHSQHSHISAFNNFVNLHQKRLISVSYHYRLLWAQSRTHFSVELGVLKKLRNTLTSMECCYLRDHLQITYFASSL